MSFLFFSLSMSSDADQGEFEPRLPALIIVVRDDELTRVYIVRNLGVRTLVEAVHCKGGRRFISTGHG